MRRKRTPGPQETRKSWWWSRRNAWPSRTRQERTWVGLQESLSLLVDTFFLTSRALTALLSPVKKEEAGKEEEE